MESSPGQTRGGGRDTPHGFLFELTGGRLCLDLVNTIDNRPTPRRRELLTGFRRLLSWGHQAGILTAAEAGRLRRQANRHPRRAEATWRRAVCLRENLFRIFSAVAAGRHPPRTTLADLNTVLSDAQADLRIVFDRHGFGWNWRKPESMEGILYPVVRSAAELLTSPEVDRIRECAFPECAWLFLDQSRNRSRRWCDMSVCGNRTKARRHYRKSRARIRRQA
jgi:predicted RNA-binding Zn ribbon-like protein